MSVIYETSNSLPGDPEFMQLANCNLATVGVVMIPATLITDWVASIKHVSGRAAPVQVAQQREPLELEKHLPDQRAVGGLVEQTTIDPIDSTEPRTG